MSNRGVTYADAGVDIDAGDEAVERIDAAAKRTHIKGVLAGVGGFGGLFSLKEALGTLDDPVLVSGTDGVGTKLLVAIEADRHETIGQDLVAMCVNDVLTSGARPLFFLDYYATGKLAPAHMARVVTGIANACERSGCALIGGETAEVPGLYARGHYDLAGFVVGAVERAQLIDGTKVTAGDAIIGVASSGLHSNGYSLARRVVFDVMKRTIAQVADELLEPTKLYVKPVLDVLARFDVHAMAHITGGGLPMNLTRAFPAGTAARVDASTWVEPAIFNVLRAGGPIEEKEMRRTFNCGIGFCLVVPHGDAKRVVAHLKSAHGETAYVIGAVVADADAAAGEGAVLYA
jgi:phosphoribosylformylglycinamidine cyclo-ligase